MAAKQIQKETGYRIDRILKLASTIEIQAPEQVARKTFWRIGRNGRGGKTAQAVRNRKIVPPCSGAWISSVLASFGTIQAGDRLSPPLWLPKHLPE